MPARTLLMVTDVAKLPVSEVARSLRPKAEPASSTYDVGAAPVGAALQRKVTVEPVTAPVKLTGAPGNVGGGAGVG